MAPNDMPIKNHPQKEGDATCRAQRPSSNAAQKVQPPSAAEPSTQEVIEIDEATGKVARVFTEPNPQRGEQKYGILYGEEWLKELRKELQDRESTGIGLGRAWSAIKHLLERLAYKRSIPEHSEQQEWTRKYIQSLCSNLLSDHDADCILSRINAALATERAATGCMEVRAMNAEEALAAERKIIESQHNKIVRLREDLRATEEEYQQQLTAERERADHNADVADSIARARKHSEDAIRGQLFTERQRCEQAEAANKRIHEAWEVDQQQLQECQGKLNEQEQDTKRFELLESLKLHVILDKNTGHVEIFHDPNVESEGTFRQAVDNILRPYFEP